jgi:hypothetical protein
VKGVYGMVGWWKKKREKEKKGRLEEGVKR